MAYDLRASGKYVSIGRSQAIELTGDISVMCSIQPQGVAGIRQVLTAWDASGAPFTGWGFRINVGSGSTSTLAYYSNGVGAWSNSTGTVTTLTWHCVGFVVSGTGAGAGTFYIDGSSAGTWTHTAPGAYSGTDKQIGANPNGIQTMLSRVGDMAVWNRALAAGEVTSIQSGHASPLFFPNGLVAYWPLYEGLANVMTGETGTAQGGAAQTGHEEIFYPGSGWVGAPSAAAASPVASAAQVATPGSSSPAAGVMISG